MMQKIKERTGFEYEHSFCPEVFPVSNAIPVGYFVTDFSEKNFVEPNPNNRLAMLSNSSYRYHRIYRDYDRITIERGIGSIRFHIERKMLKPVISDFIEYDLSGKPVIDYDRKPSRDIDGNYVQPCKYWDPSIEQEYFDDIRSIVNLNKEDGRVFLWSLDIKYKIL